MADNIKIVGNILNTTTVIRYTAEDINLIPSSQLQENFGGGNDYIESYVYDAGGNLLNTNYNYREDIIAHSIPVVLRIAPLYQVGLVQLRGQADS